jgi:hypothetical protein
MADEAVETGDVRVAEPANPFKKNTAEEPPKKERKPLLRTTKPKAEPLPPRKPVKRKKNMSEGLSLAWGFSGMVVAGKFDGPVGACMQLQAPYAGKQLNKAIASNEALYRWLSPIFGHAEAVSDLGTVLLPPILVGTMERKPELMPVLMPMLRSLLRPTLKEMAAEIKREKETLASIGATEPDEMEAQLDEMLAAIFGLGGEPSQAAYAEPEEPIGEDFTVDGPVPSEVL